MDCLTFSRQLYMLRTCKNLLSQKALKTLYYSLVHCHFVYGNQIWSSASAGTISELLRKQRRQFGSSLTAVTTNTLNPFLKVQTSCRCQICVISLNCNLCRDLFKGFYPAPLIIPGLETLQGDQKLFPWCSAIMMIFMCPYPDSKHSKVSTLFLPQTVGEFSRRKHQVHTQRK